MNKHSPSIHNRERILDAAAALFEARGYQATRMEDVAAASGVSKSNLYYHFHAKEDLAAAVIAQQSAVYTQGVARGLGNPALPATERLRAYLQDAFCSGPSGLCFPDRLPEALCKLLYQLRTRIEADLNVCLASGIDSGELRADLVPEAAARLLTAYAEGVRRRREIGGPPDSREDAAQVILTLLQPAAPPTAAVDPEPAPEPAPAASIPMRRLRKLSPKGRS